MKVIIPKCLNIGCHKVKTFINKALIDAASYGRAMHIQKHIYLNPTNTYSHNVVTWWHEVVHEISCIYCADALEEKAIDSLAEGLGQVFKEMGIEFDFSNLEEIAKE